MAEGVAPSYVEVFEPAYEPEPGACRCPRCGFYDGWNHVAVRSAPGLVIVGWRCPSCGHEWGFESRPDEEPPGFSAWMDKSHPFWRDAPLGDEGLQSHIALLRNTYAAGCAAAEQLRSFLAGIIEAIAPEPDAGDTCRVCSCHDAEWDEAHSPDCAYLLARHALGLPEIGVGDKWPADGEIPQGTDGR